MSFFVGIIIGVVLSFSNESFYELLSSNKKMVFTIMNGTIDYLGFFWKVLFQLLMPILLLFVINLNYYTGMLSYFFVSYQSASMVVSFSAVITTYGFFGIFNVFCLLLPINTIYFICLLFFCVTCRERSVKSLRSKKFNIGFNDEFYLKSIIAVVSVIVVSLLASVIVPITLKTFAFIIY